MYIILLGGNGEGAQISPEYALNKALFEASTPFPPRGPCIEEDGYRTGPRLGLDRYTAGLQQDQVVQRKDLAQLLAESWERSVSCAQAQSR